MASLMTTKLKPQAMATVSSAASARSARRRASGSPAIRRAPWRRRRARSSPARAEGSRPPRSGAEAAVDQPGVAGDEAGLVGGQEGDHGGDFLRASHAA